LVRDYSSVGKTKEATGSVLLVLLLVIILLYSAVFGFCAVVRKMSFSFQAYDLGTFDQGIWLVGYSADHFVTVKGLHFLGD